MLERAPVPHETSLAYGRGRRETRDAPPPLVRCGGGTRASRLAPHGETVPRPTRRGRCGHAGGRHDKRPPRHRRPPAVRPPPPGVLAGRAAARREEQPSVAPVRANYAPAAAAGPVATLRASVCVTCPRQCVCFWWRGARAGAVGPPRPAHQCAPPGKENGGGGSAHAPPGTPRCARRVRPLAAGGARTWGGRRGCVCDAYRLGTTHHPSPIRRTFKRYHRLCTRRPNGRRSAVPPPREERSHVPPRRRVEEPPLSCTAVHSCKNQRRCVFAARPGVPPLLSQRPRPTGGGGRGRKPAAPDGIAGRLPPGAPYTSHAHWSSLPARRCAAPCQRAPRAAAQPAVAAAPTRRARQKEAAAARRLMCGARPGGRCARGVDRPPPGEPCPILPFPPPPSPHRGRPVVLDAPLARGDTTELGLTRLRRRRHHQPPPRPPHPSVLTGEGRRAAGPTRGGGSLSSTKSAGRARRGGPRRAHARRGGRRKGLSVFSVPRRRTAGAGRGGARGGTVWRGRAGSSASPRPPARPDRPAPVRSLPAVPLGANRGGSAAWARLVGVAVESLPLCHARPAAPLGADWVGDLAKDTAGGVGRGGRCRGAVSHPAPPPGVQSGGRQ